MLQIGLSGHHERPTNANYAFQILASCNHFRIVPTLKTVFLDILSLLRGAGRTLNVMFTSHGRPFRVQLTQILILASLLLSCVRAMKNGTLSPLIAQPFLT